MLNLAGSVLSGSVRGKAVAGAVRLGPGVRLVPGRYRLLPPVDDPIYGTVVTALPVSAAPVGRAYELRDVMVSSAHRTSLASNAFVFCDRVLPGVPTAIVYNGHAGLGAALREAAGGDLTVA